MSARVHSLLDIGTDGMVIDIECHLSNNLPNIVIVGFGNRAIEESKERIRGAFASSKTTMPRKRITINMAPADIPKDSSSFDLPIAAAIAIAGNPASQSFAEDEAILGELGLDGSVRPVRGIIGKLLAGRANGIKTFYIPEANLAQARLVPKIRLIPLRNLGQLLQHLAGTSPLKPYKPGRFSDLSTLSRDTEHTGTNLNDVTGQQHAKRALEIAAAGGHNILLGGPPGTGKSMLARALPSILPALTKDEMLEVTHLHSLAGRNYDTVIHERPFRSPHHSSSHISMIGGGTNVRPGEMSLAHRGILFFDEFPEFSRQTIEALRQPLEGRAITISRVRDSVQFPADFMLVATANPCPCGYYGTSRACTCPAHAIERYRLKLSGPILDRIDLYANVHEVDHARLLGAPEGPRSDDVIRNRVVDARAVQADRFGGSSLNASMTNQDIRRLAAVDTAAKRLLDTAGKQLDLSARAYLRTVKVARTIADLAGDAAISALHVSEALQYRSRPA